jgi:hypothetical protein
MDKPFMIKTNDTSVVDDNRFYHFEKNKFKEKDNISKLKWKQKQEANFENYFCEIIDNLIIKDEHKNKFFKDAKQLISQKIINWEHFICLHSETDIYKNNEGNFPNFLTQLLTEIIDVHNNLFEDIPNSIILQARNIKREQIPSIKKEDFDNILSKHSFNHPNNSKQSEFMMNLEKISKKIIKILRTNAFRLAQLDSKDFLKVKFVGDPISAYTTKFYKKINYLPLTGVQEDQIKKIFMDERNEDSNNSETWFEMEKILRNTIIKVIDKNNSEVNQSTKVSEVLDWEYNSTEEHRDLIGALELIQVMFTYFKLEEKIFDVDIRSTILEKFNKKDGKIKKKIFKNISGWNKKEIKLKVLQFLKIFVGRYLHTGKLEKELNKLRKEKLKETSLEETLLTELFELPLVNIIDFEFFKKHNLNQEEKTFYENIKKALDALKVKCKYIIPLIEFIQKEAGENDSDY